MKKLTQFDRQNLAAVRQSLNAALKSVEEEYGIKLGVGNIRFTTNMFKVSIEANITGENALPISAPGLAPIGSKFRARGVGQVYTVVEHKPSNRSYPIIAVSPNGTRYKFSNEIATAYPVA
jgi:hypothetical protein